MPTPEERITALEAVIEGYDNDLRASNNVDEKRELRALITARSANLTALLNQQQQGNAISLYSFISNSHPF